MNIEFKENQLNAFFQMVYLGNHVINDVRLISEQKLEYAEIYNYVYDKFLEYLKTEKKIDKESAAVKIEKVLLEADNFADYYSQVTFPLIAAQMQAEKNFGKNYSGEKLFAEEMYENILETAQGDIEIKVKGVESKEPEVQLKEKDVSKIKIEVDYDKLYNLFQNNKKSLTDFLSENNLNFENVVNSFLNRNILISSGLIHKMCIYLGMPFSDFCEKTSRKENVVEL